jgi:hypothetical protein
VFAARKVQNVAVVTAITALIALFPLNCTADMREAGAELAFCVGGKPGYCHQNDTHLADGSAVATAVQRGLPPPTLQLF